MKRENWKYIILGIGLGFLLSAALFLKFGGKEKETLSEREVIEKAKELGMVFLTEKMAEPSGNEKKENQETVPEEKADQENLPKEESEEMRKEEPSVKSEEKEKTETSQSDVGEKAEKSQNTQTQNTQSVPQKTKNTKQKDSNTIQQVITEEDKDVQDLTPPKNPNRPKQGNVLDTNHF